MSALWLLLLSTLFACGQGCPTAVADPVSVLTQHSDNSRTGQNLNETLLNTSDVNVNSFGKLFSCPVDGEIYTQPLYVPNLAIPSRGTHNVVFVATMHNSVYALDADNGAQLWQVNMGPSIPATDAETAGSGYVYQDIQGEIGILGTPAIDPVADTIYFIARTKEVSGSKTNYVERLHALDITTGLERANSPVVIQATLPVPGKALQYAAVFDSLRENQRPGLLLLNGIVYIAWGSHGDIKPYYGWVMGYNALTLQQVSVFNTALTGGGNAVWQAGQGLTADAQGNLYFMTGNGASTVQTGGVDYGECFVKLVPGPNSLTATDWFMPSNAYTLNYQDFDLGSAGVLGIPGTSLVVGGGKQGVLYLVNTDSTKGSMGQFNSSTDQVVQEFQATVGHIHGAPIYWNSALNGPTIYVWGERDYLKAFQFNYNAASPLQSSFSTTPLMESTMRVPTGMPGAFMTVSSNGNQAGTGVVWAAHPYAGDANQATVGGILRAFDANNLTNELWDSKQNAARDDFGNFAKFCPPTVVNGKVYLATFSNQLMVYGLLPTVAPPAPSTLTATAGSGQVALTWAAAPGAASYTLSYGTASGTYTVTLPGLTGTSTTVTGLTNGTPYYFAVRAVNAGGTSPYSPEATATPQLPPPPPAPSTLTATAGNGQVALTWAAAPGASSYTLSYGTASGAYTATVPGLTGTVTTVTGLTNGTPYYFAVRAVNAGGTSPYSPEATATPQLPPPPPAPTGLTATPGSGQVSLNWTATTGASTYNVYRGTGAGAEASIPLATGLTTPAYTDKAVTNGTAYFYMVTAVNAGGEGRRSAEATATPLLIIAPGIAIDCGGGAAAPFVADTDFVGGTISGGTHSAISTVGVTNPAPQAVYQTARYGNPAMSYVVPNLTPGAAYTVRLHFDEGGVNRPGMRVFGVSINGQVVLSDFDIYATAGGQNKAVVESFPETADGFGKITVAFTNITNYAIVSGIEVGTSGSGPPSPPPAPTGLTATPVNGQVTLAWAATSGATSYNLYRSTTPGGEGTTPYKTALPGLTYMDTGLTNGTAYYYTVTAVNATGESPQSTEASATPQLPPAPPAPSTLAATAGSGQVALTWAAAPGAASYTLSYGTASGTYTATVPGLTGLTYTVTGLTNGTPYFFAVQAVNVSGTSPYSPEATATPQLPSPPAAPSTLTASAGNAQAALTWSAVAGASSYTVSYGTATGVYTTRLPGLAGLSTTVTGLTNGTPYFFVVQAVNASGAGPDSPEATATPSAVVAAPGVAIDCGGAAAGTFVADTGFTGGTRSGGTTSAISIIGVVNPAPQTVYQTGRFGNPVMSYVVPNLTPGASYTVRLHFAEYGAQKPASACSA